MQVKGENRTIFLKHDTCFEEKHRIFDVVAGSYSISFFIYPRSAAAPVSFYLKVIHSGGPERCLASAKNIFRQNANHAVMGQCPGISERF